MCLVSFAIGVSKRWPLVVASNRDEFFNRPTLPMAWWTSASGQRILSGRDLRAGGTWMGMTPGGRIAWLTNVRQANMPPSPRSRGDLVMQWLEGEMDAAQFMAMADPLAFEGFNLLLGDFQSSSWTWLSNRVFDATSEGHNPHRAQEKSWCSRPLAPGIYGLSNASLDTPWPKTVSLKASLTAAIADAQEAGDNARLTAPIWQALASQQHASAHDLPDTGLPVALERALSSAFVDDAGRGYGTRCSTVLVASLSGPLSTECWGLEVEERTFVRTLPPTGSATAARTDAILASPVRHALQWQRALTSDYPPGPQELSL